MKFSSGDSKFNPSSFPDKSIPAWPWKRRDLLQDNVSILSFSSAHEKNPPPAPSDSDQTVPSTLDIREREGCTTDAGQSKQANERVEPPISFPDIAKTTQTRRKALPIHRITPSSSSTSQPLSGLGAQRSGNPIRFGDVENGQIWGSQPSLPDLSEEPTTAASKTNKFKPSQGTLFGSSHISFGANEDCPKRDQGLPFQFEKLQVYGEMTEAPKKLTVSDPGHTFLPKENGGPLANPANAGSATHESKQSQADHDEEEQEIQALDPIDDPKLQKQLKLVIDQLRKLCRRMQSCQLSQDSDSKLSRICQETQKLSLFEDREERIVGFIGETGAGHSVINSILDQKGLARSSGAGSACTSVPMEYRYIDDSHPRSYTIEAEFMSETEVLDLIDELLRSIWRVCGKENEILSAFKEEALRTLSSRLTGSDSSQFLFVADDLEDCKEQLDFLTSGPEDSKRPALWPFIKLIRVYINLPILKHGLVLADLPGLRDTNHARVRATEKYLAAKCDEVFIVANISRSVSNESIYEIMNKCGKMKRIRIVCTRADEISPEESARGTTPFAKQVKKMNAEIKQLEVKVARAARERQKAQGDERAKLALIEAMIERKAILMSNRNESVKRELRDAIQKRENRETQTIRIFCIGNELYRNPPSKLAKKYRDLSGVGELQTYCRAIPAEARTISAVAYIQHEVPALVHSIHQWMLTGHESVKAEEAEKLQAVLRAAEGSLRQELLSPSGLLIAVQKEALPTFDNLVIEHLREYTLLAMWWIIIVKQNLTRAIGSHVDKLMMTEFITVSEKWRGVSRLMRWNIILRSCCKWLMYHKVALDKLCRPLQKIWISYDKKRGYSCWNDQLMEQVRSWLDPRWDMADEWLLAHKLRMSKSIAGLFEGFSSKIKAHRHAAPDVIENLILALQHRGENMQQALSRGMSEFQQKVKLARQHTLDGHNHSSLIADLMRKVYNACSRESGVGSDKRRKEAMQRHLSDTDFYAKYLESTKSFYQNTIRASMVTVKEELKDQIDLIAGDFAGVTMSSEETPEPEAEPELAKELAKKIPLLQESLDRASKSLQLTSS
ncbi:Dynamin family protein [Penicillium ucsense]|uniref:Dynamin family protein n=1 Tax=Penicillium ucsense TaxID=2839758 RepID=A0A8J8WM31_9EURO|nr:Dynamin family protein [Penicillium ucsense]KAF7737247.1 Dynamin family protein [Penicillium ucsense]